MNDQSQSVGKIATATLRIANRNVSTIITNCYYGYYDKPLPEDKSGRTLSMQMFIAHMHL